MGWWIGSLGVKRDAHNDDRMAEERKRQFEVPERGADDGWWGGAHAASGHTLFSDPATVEVKFVRWKVAREHETIDLMHLDFWFPVHAWLDTNEPGAFQKSSSMAMKTPPKTSTSESHLKSTVYWLQTQGCSGVIARSRRPQWLCAPSWLTGSAVGGRFSTICLHGGCKLQRVWSRLSIWWYIMSVDEHCSIDTLQDFP